MKLFFIGSLIVFMVTAAPYMYGEDKSITGRMDDGMMMDKYAPKSDMSKHQEMMQQGMMMHMMMMKEVVPTADGGVVVLMGDKLFKYDKNLELKKETELKIDWDRMQKMMQEMKQRMSQMSQ